MFRGKLPFVARSATALPRVMSANLLCRIRDIFHGLCGHVSVLGLALISHFFFSMSNDSLADSNGVEVFHQQIEPILEESCYDCHGYGSSEGGLTLDAFESGQEALGNRELWWRALKLLRAGIMPPADHGRISADELSVIELWIKTHVFESDPNNPDPGHATLRRLNRTEYKNTIRELLNVDYNTELHFPADDSGHGFDNISDVQTISPLLLEKYVIAAREIVTEAVPTISSAPVEHIISGQQFRPEGAKNVDQRKHGPLWLSYYEPAWVSYEHEVEHSGAYEIIVELQADEKFVDNKFDYNRCRVLFKLDGQSLFQKEFERYGGKPFRFRYKQFWQAGPHQLTFELEPLTPEEPQVRSLSMRIKRVKVRGPLEKQHWIRTEDHRNFFPGVIPDGEPERREYARELLGRFAERAYRRPVDQSTVERLASLAEQFYSQPGKNCEAGIAEAMTAVLASPRFIFRDEEIEKSNTDAYPLVDEYTLASRLSYFLWSTMPDDELFQLASKGRLRENLSEQIARMTADDRWQQFIQQFAGQWLHARDVDTVNINTNAVMRRDRKPDPELVRVGRRFRHLRRKDLEKLTEEEQQEFRQVRKKFFASFKHFKEFDLDGSLRNAMRRETEMLLEYLFREDRSLSELLDSDYTFLNDKLARHYGIEGIEGNHMRLATLPVDSPRGGVLTQGTVLTTTSNPNRTSPVKRGVFIMENILGVPPASPPPNVPPLEDEENTDAADKPTLRETLEKHRLDPMCSSCHDRMDPLGLALENFNALGLWRETDRGLPIDASGELVTGQTFSDIRQLKRILLEEHRRDFYRCLTEKLLVFAIGRGLEYYDVQTVDSIVDRLEATGGKPSVLLAGVIDSSAFQRGRPQKPIEGDSLSDRSTGVQAP